MRVCDLVVCVFTTLSDHDFPSYAYLRLEMITISHRICVFPTWSDHDFPSYACVQPGIITISHRMRVCDLE